MPGMRDVFDIAVIGSGVVGAAVAARLAAPGRRSCVVLERAERPGGDATERNSGVIHAGIYYPPGSLKTRLCIAGNRLLYEWAARAGVPHARCGKLVVAAAAGADAGEEEAALAALYAHGRSVGVEGLEMLSASALARLEPAVRGRAALLSATSGIVDPCALARSLLAAAERAGADVACGAEVRAIERAGDLWRLATARGSIGAAAVVNAAGLCADEVAALAGFAKYRIFPCRGDYFRLRRPLPVRRLVYPVKRPGAPGLGVHLTPDLSGEQRLGPDAEYVASKSDYGPVEGKRAAFAEAARRLFEGVREEDLAYDSCGIRAKLRAPGDPEEKDFVVAEDGPRFVNLVGIESPGLTSALAIAEEVERILG